ncbi:hypothetical protein [Raoultella terrigena]|uniref:hypothetical protein n=1 Tax=Raoultella terrigena TaxID=577 RepID=UPI00384B36FF
MDIELLNNEIYSLKTSEAFIPQSTLAMSFNLKNNPGADAIFNALSINEDVTSLHKLKKRASAVTRFESGTIGFESSVEVNRVVDVIYSLFSTDSIELGYESKTFYFINNLIKEYGQDFIDISLTQLMRKHIIGCNNPVLMCKFLTLLTEFDAAIIPTTSAISITSFAHKKYNSVKEMVLISIELWKNKDALNLLEDMEPYQRRNLEVYRLKIIEMLKGL